ncbi:hypothetical protein JCM21142_3785 [Saccharicrinis fermentans DSM 9555 = JCM 21142]|uniref:Uncharacterized protein n=1 Tax=Saccharicrinis fermentans DSM 9555 = JCM 21142 TaxID=869213 RepID=W7Y3K9_9BACT|nr:hypothetical protein JCM21142_3785 [Saccharicrinis fermentans DSM 9555 = JCM 21142]
MFCKNNEQCAINQCVVVYFLVFELAFYLYILTHEYNVITHKLNIDFLKVKFCK